MLRRNLAVVFLGSILGCGSLGAAGPGPLTLAAAQRTALQHNVDLVSAQAQVEVAIAQLHTAREFPNPSLSLSTAKIATDGTGNGTATGNRFLDRSYDSVVALSQLFEIGKRRPRRDAARAGQSVAEAQRDDVRRLLLQSVSQAYVAALEAQEESRALAQSAASLRREAGLAATRLSAGDIAATEKAQIEITAGQFELAAAAARRAAISAVVVLEALLGEPEPAGQTPLADTLASLPLPPILSVDAPIHIRPDLVAAEAGLAKAEADFVLQKRGPMPDLTLSAQFEHNPPAQPNTVGLGVSLPLPLWNRNGGGIRVARAARDQAQAQLDKVRVQAVAEVATARAALDEASGRASAYVKDLLPKSAQVAETVAYAYEHGGASLLELLAAERSDNDIRLSSSRALADAASASFAFAAALNRLEPCGETIPSR